MLNILLDLFFPRSCYRCGSVGKYLCSECISLWQPPVVPEITNLTEVIACVPFDKLARKVMHDFKYNFISDLAADLAEMLQARLEQANVAADFAVPVPVSKRRERWRGYNQSGLLAARLKLPAVKALARTRHTRVQAELNRAERLTNLKEAFQVTADVAGKKVLLVDDVCTTGTTLSECAQELLAAGAESVAALVWAYTPLED